MGKLGLPAASGTGLLCRVLDERALDFISRHFLVDQFRHDRAGYLVGDFPHGSKRSGLGRCYPLLRFGNSGRDLRFDPRPLSFDGVPQ